MSYQISERLSKSAFRILSKGRVALVASGCLLTTTVSLAAPVGEEKWGAHIDIEGKGGTDRNLGEAGFFLPLAQNDTSLLFADIRTRMDDQSSREGNFGLGARHMLESGWNVGGYGYFDRRRSSNYNYFNQVTLGAEALGQDWDFRANAYLPQGTRVRELSTTAGVTSASLSGASILVNTTAGITQEERSLKGFDAELGWRAPIFDSNESRQLRLYAGGYRFADADVKVQGPRLRAELAMENLEWFGKGTALFLGAETQHDSARGDQSFVSIRLRIPLGDAGARTKTLTAQERRMTAPVIRDIDIVTQGRTFVSTPASVETATATAGGQTITVVDSVTTTTAAALNTALATAGANTVILSGTFNTLNTPVVLQTGQTVMGQGTLSVQTPSGRTATLTTPGATINNTVTAVGSTAESVSMASDSTLTGLTINQSSTANSTLYGVRANNVNNVTISNNTITSSHNQNGNSGIRVEGTSSNVTVSGNTVTVDNSHGGGIAVGMFLKGTSITVANNTLSVDAHGVNEYAFYRAGALSIDSSTSIGNSLTQAVTNNCGTGGGIITGTLFYTDASGAALTCP